MHSCLALFYRQDGIEAVMGIRNVVERIRIADPLAVNDKPVFVTPRLQSKLNGPPTIAKRIQKLHIRVPTIERSSDAYTLGSRMQQFKTNQSVFAPVSWTILLPHHLKNVGRSLVILLLMP